MLDLRGCSDACAVRRVLSGNREAFGALVTCYHSLVYHVALPCGRPRLERERLPLPSKGRAWSRIEDKSAYCYTARHASHGETICVSVNSGGTQDGISATTIPATQGGGKNKWWLFPICAPKLL